MLRRITSPFGLPLSTDLAAIHVRDYSGDEQGLFSSWIGTATRHVERMTNRALLSQRWVMTRDRFPAYSPVSSYVPFGGALGGSIGGYPGYVHGYPGRFGFKRGEDLTPILDLRVCPVAAVESITYVDGSGDTQTLDPSLYQTDVLSEPGRVSPAWGSSWPYARQQMNSVQVTFWAGYASPFTVNLETSTLTAYGRLYTNGEVVRMSCPGAGSYAAPDDECMRLPSGLQAGIDYYVINSTGTQFQLSLTANGSAVSITRAGSAGCLVGELPETAIQAILFLVGHYYNNREAVTTDVISKELELGLEPLIWDLRWTANA